MSVQCPKKATASFDGTTEDGAPCKCYIDVAAASGKNASVTITQRVELLN
jgi:hypothetical protein